MSNKCKPVAPPCTERVVEHVRSANDPFTLCVGTSMLTWDGEQLSVAHGTPIPDGEYTQFSVRHGCIISAGQALVPEYTPPPCVEPPSPCGGASSAAVVSPAAGNLTTQTSLGLLTKVFIQGGGGTGVTGTGVVGDPFVITPPTSSGPNIIAGTSEVEVNNTPSGAISIGLKNSGIGAGTYAGITFNSHGIATGYAAPAASAISQVVGAGEVAAENQSGVVTVGLNPSAAGGSSYDIGGYSVSVSQGGTIESMEQNITLTPGGITLGGYNVTLNALGSITAVERSVTLTAGTFNTVDGKTVHYDEFGTITQIT